ncbi:hypothetical protein [Gracilibacillus boraciitolerans]|uniref:hypothetical protein n=1 Tax=Gracilibacillus boraciitolerans TaxID=307521 RepID=UPI001F3ACF64|nr:hypothetical protein [Gracilibacillus boraciitolerans]
MVAMTKPNAIINIIAFMITMILVLVLYSAEDSIRKQANQAIFSFFKHPYLLICSITILFLLFNHMAPLEFNISNNHEH